MSQTIFSRESQSTPRSGLPLSWYFDPEILEIERRELFAAGPTYAGARIAAFSGRRLLPCSAVSRPGKVAGAA